MTNFSLKNVFHFKKETKETNGNGAAKQLPIKPSTPTLKEGISTAFRKPLSECRVLAVDISVETFFVQASLRKTKKIQSCDAAHSPSEALAKISEAAKNGKYDFVVCNLGLNGLELEKEAGKISPGTQFIFTSAREPKDFPEGKPVLRKPYSLASLASMLEQYCES